MQLRLCIASAVIVASALPAPHARADQREAVIAVLPLDVADERLGIYSKPVADAVAQGLRRATELTVEPLSLAGAVPARVSLVVDGRIVAVGKRKVKLEARIRDPIRGATIARSVATRVGPLGKIDKLAAALAEALAPRLVAGVDAQKRNREASARAASASPPASPDAGSPALSPASPAPEAAAKPRDGRTGFLVIDAGGRATRDNSPVAAIATRAGHWLVERLGHRPVPGQGQGVPAIDSVRQQLASAGVPYALMIDVREVDYTWRGRVLSARGRVRVVVVDAAGRRLFDRTARTGTQVGSRGDGQAALAHYVAIQAIDIVAPHIKRAIER